MSFVHGSRAVIQFGTAGTPGTPTDISQFVKSANLPFTVDKVEITAFGATAKSYLPGLEDSTISIEGSFHATLDAHLIGIRRLANIAFVYGPAGNTAGNPRWSGICMLTNYEIETGVDGEATYSAEFQVIGVVTRGVF